jgi:hypothetical protein
MTRDKQEDLIEAAEKLKQDVFQAKDKVIPHLGRLERRLEEIQRKSATLSQGTREALEKLFVQINDRMTRLKGRRV